jgi:hypothetical protein
MKRINDTELQNHEIEQINRGMQKSRDAKKESNYVTTTSVIAHINHGQVPFLRFPFCWWPRST